MYLRFFQQIDAQTQADRELRFIVDSYDTYERVNPYQLHL